jgi:hypothetical protein
VLDIYSKETMGSGKKETRDSYRNPPPWNFYYCPYILRTGEVCNRRCYHPDGCKAHRNSLRQAPCIHLGCDKKTFSDYGTCKIHLDKYCSRAFYQRQKLEKNQVSDGLVLG